MWQSLITQKSISYNRGRISLFYHKYGKICLAFDQIIWNLIRNLVAHLDDGNIILFSRIIFWPLNELFFKHIATEHSAVILKKVTLWLLTYEAVICRTYDAFISLMKSDITATEYNF